MISGQILWEIA